MRRGLALVLVVGVLGVLAVLGSAFAVLSRLERKSAHQRVYATQAWLLARSGLEDAQARLGMGQEGGDYAGEDWNADGVFSQREKDAEVHRKNVFDTLDCPAAQAMRPSFFKRDLLGQPLPIRVDGRERGCSGRLAQGSWALKVEPDGGFHVNGGVPGWPLAVMGKPTYNAVLRRMLGTLAEAIGREGGPVAQADGERLIDARPGGAGWTSFEQIRDGALGGSQAKLDALKPYLALSAWVDFKVIAPNVDWNTITAALGNPPVVHSWVEIKAAHRNLSNRFAPLPEQIFGMTCGRAPVSLAWARRRRPALVALMAGLKGVALDESTSSGHTDALESDAIGTLVQVEIPLSWVAGSPLQSAVDQLLASTSELRTWEQVHAFCDGLTGLTQGQRDLLKAGFDPNSDLNKFNPDPSLARAVDKSDLIAPYYSTELNLTPLGKDRFASCGRVLDREGRLLASRTLSATSVGESLLRLTTQGEFAAGDLGSLQTAGDEVPRAYGAVPYITRSAGTARTFGSRLPGLSPGLSLQTLPEPHTVALPADWDGQVRLATVEEGTATSMLFLATWTSGFDSDDVGGVTPNTPSGAWEAGLTPSRSLWPNSNTASPGMLHGDGIYVEKSTRWPASPSANERGRQPGYAAAGNMAPWRGVLSFWLKPGYDCERGNRKHEFVSNCRVNATGGLAQVFLSTGSQKGGYAGFYRSWYCPDGFKGFFERIADLTAPQPATLPRRWRLLTWFWDMVDTSSGCEKVLVDRGQAPNASVGLCSVQDLITADTRVLDFTLTDPLGVGAFYLGRGAYVPAPADQSYAPHSAWYLTWPDATFDELALYDFGPVTASARTEASALALDRFARGRFYKESGYSGLGAAGNTAGEWFSAPIDLGASRVQALAWTQIVPRGLKAPAVAVPEDGDPGQDGRILMELADAAGTGYAVPGTHSDAASSRIGRPVPSPFRLHAVFQPNLEDPDNRAILDPLALDDVSLVYRPVSAAAFSAWREGE